MAPHEKTELRGLCPAHLAQALDAIAMARGLDRNTYVVTVLENEVKKVAHEATVLHRALRGNPYLTEGGAE
jgi:NAD(P)H-hydrate repair Nnr-like enzyme with NAD(P)H-hydrate dehydratase domain